MLRLPLAVSSLLSHSGGMFGSSKLPRNVHKGSSAYSDNNQEPEHFACIDKPFVPERGRGLPDLVLSKTRAPFLQLLFRWPRRRRRKRYHVLRWGRGDHRFRHERFGQSIRLDLEDRANTAVTRDFRRNDLQRIHLFVRLRQTGLIAEQKTGRPGEQPHSERRRDSSSDGQRLSSGMRVTASSIIPVIRASAAGSQSGEAFQFGAR